jgi:hypothetical protein
MCEFLGDLAFLSQNMRMALASRENLSPGSFQQAVTHGKAEATRLKAAA